MCRHIRCAILASVWQPVDSLMSRVFSYRVIVQTPSRTGFEL
jgi:hypothetical protein